MWGEAERNTLYGVLDERASRLGDKVALVVDGEEVTYDRLVERSIAYANALMELGVGKGDTVSMLMENCIESIYTELACARIGAIEVMLNTAYRGDFLRHQVHNSESRVVLVDGPMADRFADIASELPHLQTLLVRAVGDATSEGLSIDGVDVRDVAEFLEQGSTEWTPLDDPPTWKDPCTIVYTSGTTGPSKGAVMSQNYLVSVARQLSAGWAASEDDVFYAVTPMFHLAAKAAGVLGALYRGATCVVDQRFSVQNFWDRVEETGATGTVLLGSMLMMLYQREPSKNEGCKTIIAAPIPGHLQADMEERWGCQFRTFYAVSETVPLMVGGQDERLKPGTAGKANEEYFDVRLFNDDDEEVATGEVGEVCVRPRKPYVMFDGYFNDPEAMVRLTRNLWYHTGDLGKFDEDGYFYFVDRKKDYIRRRGENISSFELERAVSTLEGVSEVAAIGLPSEFTEDEVKICVVLRDGAELKPEAIMDHCVANMPYFAVPRYVEIMDALPKTPTQRVQKYKLRQDGVTATTWDREAAGYVVERD